jgi:hypothetical protein
MHPYLMEALVHDRVAALRRGATPRSPRNRGVVVRRQRRERFGWLLVTVGLRLVGEAPGRATPARSTG